MCYLTMGTVLRNVPLGDFIVVQTIQSAFTQTWMGQPAAHGGCVVQPTPPRLQNCTARYCAEYDMQL